MSCNHEEFTDPRGRGACRKCGRLIPNPFTPEVVDEFFNRLRENLNGSSEEDHGPAFEWFKTNALTRLQAGAKDYGNDGFLKDGRDLPQEFIEELLDSCNYILMERIKNQPTGSAGFQLDLAAYHAFYAYQAMLSYRQKRT